MSSASASKPGDRRSLAAVLAAAPDLVSLGTAADALGLGSLLDRAFASFLPEPSLSRPARQALREVRNRGQVFSLRELLETARPDPHGWLDPPEIEDELRVVLAPTLARFAPKDAIGPEWESPEELLDWARHLGLEELFHEQVTSLPGLVSDRILRDRLRKIERHGITVFDLASSPTRGNARHEPLLGRATYAALRDATRAYVQGQADLAIEAVREQGENDAAWKSPPADPALVPAFERLRAIRTTVPKVPPLASRAITGPKLTWDAATHALLAELHCGRARAWDHSQAFRVHLPADDNRPASCSCNRPFECPHQLAAVEAARACLAEPEHAAMVAFRGYLATPPWRRLLSALELAATRTRTPLDDSSERLSWRVDGLRSPGVHGLRLHPYRQKRRAAGGWSQGTRTDLWSLRHLVALDERDRRIVACLSASDSFMSGPGEQSALRALLAARGHPALFLDEPDLPALSVRETSLAIEVRPDSDGGLRLAATVGGEEVPFAALVQQRSSLTSNRLVHRFDEEECLLSIAAISPEADGMLSVLAEGDPRLPPDAIPALASCAEKMATVLPIELPEAVLGDEVAPTDCVVLRLAPGNGIELGVEVLARPLPGGAVVPPGAGPARLHVCAEKESCFVHRSFDRELARATAVLASLPLPAEHTAEPEHGSRFEFQLVGEAALDLVAHLSSRPPEPDLAIEWTRPPRRVTRPAESPDLRIRVEARRDWFAVDGTIDVDGVELALAVALDAARRGARYVEATPDVFVTMSAELRRRLARAADAVHSGRHGLEFSLPGMTAVDELLEDAGHLEVAASFREILERIREARDAMPEVPAMFAEILRPYQVEGFRWLARLAAWGAGGCLADDMGLGKTLQALALLSHRRTAGPALVVAPTSVCGNWLREAERFGAPLRMVLYGALPSAERAAAIDGLGAGDVLVASYNLVARDVESLSARRFATLVLDEAQAVKNAETARARAVRALDAEVRFALSGTPLENHLGELWSLYRILVPGLLGSLDAFRQRFGLPIERDRDPARREGLACLLRPFLLRRTKAEVAPELPPRTEADVEVELSPAERRLYREASLAAMARVNGLAGDIPPERRRFEILAGITRLRLCACHPRLYDEGSRIPSSKLARLVELLVELKEEGHRALVFSQFVSHLDLVEEALRAADLVAVRLDGSTPAAQRLERVDAFQAGEADLFLISLKAGGTGLNLTAADYVIHLDPWWNPAVEDQATDRAHRIGQTRPVTVLRLVSKGTIEETILSLHAGKRELVAGVLDGADAGTRVSAEALLELLEAGQYDAPAGRPER